MKYQKGNFGPTGGQFAWFLFCIACIGIAAWEFLCWIYPHVKALIHSLSA